MAAFFIYILSQQVPELLPGFWQPFVVIAIGGTILVVAAWGAFQGDGFDRSQPAWGRRALSATLALALVFIVFHLLCGFPGFIAFLCVQEWPVRIVCPRCNKIRLVDHARCEHCEAGFAPAGKNGTEIFEQLTANYPG